MEYTTLLGAWAVAISGPCVISWLAGDLAGASRARKLYGADDEAFDGGNAVGAFEVEEWAVEGAVKPLAEAREKARSPMAFEAQIEELAIQAERRREERQRAAAAAPQQETSAPPSVLVTSEHDAQNAQVVLARYQRSMEELQHINHAREVYPVYDGWPVHELPSVRIAAPVRLSANASDLHDERVRFSSDCEETRALIALGEG